MNWTNADFTQKMMKLTCALFVRVKSAHFWRLNVIWLGPDQESSCSQCEQFKKRRRLAFALIHIGSCANEKLFSGASLGFTMFELQHRATVGSLNDRFNTRGSSQRRLASLAVAKPLLIRNQTCPEDLGCHPALPLVHTSHLTLRRLVIGGDESRRPARHRTGLIPSREQGAGGPQ